MRTKVEYSLFMKRAADESWLIENEGESEEELDDVDDMLERLEEVLVKLSRIVDCLLGLSSQMCTNVK